MTEGKQRKNNETPENPLAYHQLAEGFLKLEKRIHIFFMKNS